MGLSDEGLFLVVTLTWIPLLIIHFFIIRRGLLIVSSSGLSERNKNLVALVAFLLILFMYTIACTVTMYAAFQDRETPRPDISLAAELAWLLSPLIATLSVINFNKGLYPNCLRIIPQSKSEWKLFAKRALVFGIPLCFFFAAGDQILRQIITVAVTGDSSQPVPLNKAFLDSVGEVFGYFGENGWISGLIAFASNLSIGPLLNLFAPVSDSVIPYNNPAGTGVALYLVYAIPEEIGWTGTLYPMLINHLTPSFSKKLTVSLAILITGIVWGLWHCPFIILKWNPSIDVACGLLFNALFLCSCIATRAVLTSLVWPVRATEPVTHLLENVEQRSTSAMIRSPSILPAIFAHAALNCWWSFYTCLFNWSSEPLWSLLTGSEYSLLATAWQTAIAYLIIRNTFSNVESPETVNS